MKHILRYIIVFTAIFCSFAASRQTRQFIISEIYCWIPVRFPALLH